MRVQLLTPPKSSTAYVDFSVSPLGLMYLAASVRQGFPACEVKITDGQFHDESSMLRDITMFAPNIIGISSLTSVVSAGYRLAREIKKINPTTLVVFGGVHASCLPEEVISSPEVDVVVVGEGETAFAQIVHKVARGDHDFSDIDGIWYRTSAGVRKTASRKAINSIDVIPFPARDLVDLKKYTYGPFSAAQGVVDGILMSRGCPCQCLFCANRVWRMARPRFRLRSPRNIADELEEMKNRYGVTRFENQSDVFGIPERWSIEVCEEMVRRNLNLPWITQV
ncbi:MAG TPA: cobalamin-dependent protein, partial [Candidatus Ozemobacteraceae bacterium]|nr:cobalamin-dependent protein [Candidatus Ozemobacteraceae bacterium]